MRLPGCGPKDVLRSFTGGIDDRPRFVPFRAGQDIDVALYRKRPAPNQLYRLAIPDRVSTYPPFLDLCPQSRQLQFET